MRQQQNRHGRENPRSGGLTRRGLLGAGTAGLAAAGTYAFARHARDGTLSSGTTPGTSGDGGPEASPSEDAPRLIGDGSTADTGEQPGRTAMKALAKGERPPQFVVLSWDGAGALDDGLFGRFRKLAREIDAHMTFFLSGIYLLPESRKDRYRPPNNPVGASDIGYLSDAHIKETLRQVRSAWLEGHEIGTHFNGHFCSGSGSVAHWTPEMWRSEIAQATSFVTEWRTHTGFTDGEPLPFDYRKELVGGRTPCLLGQRNLLPTARRLGWRYDASSTGGTQVWPGTLDGLWNFPLQAVPFPGHDFEVLTMDYNMMANQSGNSTNGRLGSRARWREEARGAYRAGFRRAYEGNRAPLFIGNHFETWNGGIYMDAVELFLKDIADTPEVRFVSFRELCDWLEAQSATVLAGLRTLGVGQGPDGGWNSVTGG
ncbi:hypothetical protein ABZ929_09810 [Streptomyces physcomitrii]|uniref:hypothetical protein n=1 Tax=Streptomyces physcomitrii TaxID=2724184 RepID=UPI0033F8C345